MSASPRTARRLLAAICRPSVVLVTVGAALSLHCGGGGDGGGNGSSDPDPRCVTLCDAEEPECTIATELCLDECDARVSGMTSLCATCLLEGANGGTCFGGDVCCPDATFTSSVVDCAAACADSPGPTVSGEHGRCTSLCYSDEAECSADSEQCLQECQARVAGVSTLCATCLLEGSNGGVCDGGTVCCPDPDFPRSVSDCAAFCTE